ncbi:MAG: GMC family oxidoreductase [Gemmatimonadetes bacterium]|nr:GMC family oxidoreductase [Gemmatimonadota bacterium]
MAQAQSNRFDAIVVGSGITGGWAAKELCEKGLRTLVLEAGRDIVPERDYVEHVAPWEMHFRGRGDRKKLAAEQPIQRLCYACDEMGSRFFVNDNENPYTQTGDTNFTWIRGRQVGGRSIMWGRQVYRWSDLDFEANAKDGHGVDWPIRYADIAPWYSYVEKFVGVTGQKEGLAQLPDGEFQPPMDMTCVEEHMRATLTSKFNDGRILTIGRAAVLTRALNGRRACHYCGPCERGCRTRSYFSSPNATLPAAADTGRLTLRPDSVVESVMFDPKTRRATGVRVIDATSMQVTEYFARVVFMCASTIESARILLNSKSPEFPDGLGSSSGELGRNLMDHTMGGRAGGTFDNWTDKVSYGRRPNGIYIPRFRNVNAKTQHPDFLRGYGMQGGGSRGHVNADSTPGFGADYKMALREWGPWRFSAGGWGECLPNHDNKVTLDAEKRDKWGIPAARIDCKWGENDVKLVKDASISAAEMLEAAGARDITTQSTPTEMGLCIHEMGTARMGRDPKTSVLNAWNQVWDAKNLFVTDGACMTSSGWQNPSITYMALTARAADFAVEEMKRRNL